jgi:hypothetical protein
MEIEDFRKRKEELEKRIENFIGDRIREFEMQTGVEACDVSVDFFGEYTESGDRWDFEIGCSVEVDL